MPPIHLSSTFKQMEPGNFEYEYARTKNPSRDVLEKLLAQIESGDKAFAFASGMSAINTVCDLFGTNYHIVCSDDVYGGTRRLFDKVKSNIDIREKSDGTLPKKCDELGIKIHWKSAVIYTEGYKKINKIPSCGARNKYCE